MDSFLLDEDELEEKPYEEYLQNESLIKGRTLERIRTAMRDRSYSNLAQSIHSNDSANGDDDFTRPPDSPSEGNLSENNHYNKHQFDMRNE